MRFHFRKSVNAGPLRINFSKSGVGASVGGKFFRYTKKAGGGTRATASIPGTGISYVKDYSSTSSQKSKGSSHSTTRTSSSNQENNTPTTDYEGNSIVELLLCIFLGWMGAHRFYTHRKTSAWVYLFTFGCLGIGWIGDIFIIASRFFPNLNASVKQYIKPITYVLAFLIMIIVGGCNSETSEVPTDPATVIETTVATNEPTTAPTTEATTEPTTVATTETAAETVVGETSKSAIGAITKETEPTAQAATEAPIETPVEAEPQGNMVWISETGKKYHSSPDCSNMKNPLQITGEEAIAMNREPCSKCH